MYPQKRKESLRFSEMIGIQSNKPKFGIKKIKDRALDKDVQPWIYAVNQKDVFKGGVGTRQKKAIPISILLNRITPKQNKKRGNQGIKGEEDDMAAPVAYVRWEDRIIWNEEPQKRTNIMTGRSNVFHSGRIVNMDLMNNRWVERIKWDKDENIGNERNNKRTEYTRQSFLKLHIL